jgi:hypothetical protein
MRDYIIKSLYFLGKHYFPITGIAFWLTSLVYIRTENDAFWILTVGATIMWGMHFMMKEIGGMR